MTISEKGRDQGEGERCDGGEVALINSHQFARMLAVSLATLDRLAAGGKLPRSVTLSRQCRRWRRGEVAAWIKAGCPARRDWERDRRNDWK